MRPFTPQELAERKALVLTALFRGCRAEAAAHEANVHRETVRMWRRRDPVFDRDWRRAYREALAAGLPPLSEGARATVLLGLRRGLCAAEAATAAGVTERVVNQWRRRNEGFAAEWRKAYDEGLARCGRGRRHVRHDAAEKRRRQELFLAALRGGVPMKTAAAEAGVPWPTLIDWRKGDATFKRKWEAAYMTGSHSIIEQARRLKPDDLALRSRRKGLNTAERRAAFLHLLRNGYTLLAAACEVGVTPDTVWHWRRRDVEFACAWLAAAAEGPKNALCTYVCNPLPPDQYVFRRWFAGVPFDLTITDPWADERIYWTMDDSG